MKGQAPAGTQRPQNGTRGVQFAVPDSLSQLLQKKKIHLLEGMSVSVDLAGIVMYEVTSYGQIEGAFRLNLKGKYFPIIELGLGKSDHTNDETNLHFKTSSPYVRIGCDYNFARDLLSGNRVFGGLRYAYSNFKYDISGPDVTDPVWGQKLPFNYKSLNGNCSWMELVFGLEAKIWGTIHIGWSARYRRRLSQKSADVGQAWYLPGFGKNDNHIFGGTFNLIFDI